MAQAAAAELHGHQAAPRVGPISQAPMPRRYMPGLDGLRAVAVAAVILYHLNLPWALGGLVGVNVFFVLSGYLITDLLRTHWEETGSLDLGWFWQRRARRLLPALWSMLAVVTAWVGVRDPSRLSLWSGDVATALAYASNWWDIFHRLSYFARLGPPSPFGHLWSLAVEEQFYLVWPLFLWGLTTRVRRPAWRLAAVVLAAAASAAAMAFLYQPDGDPTRVYDGTDTRAFSLLGGAALALVWPSLRPRPLSRAARMGLEGAAVLGLGLVVWMVLATNPYQPFLYRGGWVLATLASVATVAALSHPATTIGRILGGKIPRWLGKRSYGVYLWHYPMVALTTPLVPTPGLAQALRPVAQVAATLLFAELSWRYVEEPVRRGRRVGEHAEGEMGPMARAAGAVGLAVAAVVAVSWVVSPPRGEAPPRPQGAQTVHHGGGPSPSASPRPMSQFGLSPRESRRTTCQGVSAIGDSVLLDAAPDLRRLWQGIWVDAQVGRQLYQAFAVVQRLRRQGRLGDCVVLELGTNGPFPFSQLWELVQSLGPVRRVVLVNTRVPRPWEDVVNATLAQLAARLPQKVVLANWYARSAGHGAYFWPDGVHLDPQGAWVYARMVVKALTAPLPNRLAHPSGRGR